MPQLILQPSSGTAPRRHYEKTVVSPILLSEYEDTLPHALYQELLALYPDGRARVWGATPGQYNVPAWEGMEEGDIVLFYASGEFFSSHILSLHPRTRLPSFAERLWGRNEDRQTWECVFFLDDTRSEAIPYIDVWNMVRVGPSGMLRGLTVIPESKNSDQVIEHFRLQRGRGEMRGSRATEEVLEQQRPSGRRARGQGFSMNPKARRAVEMLAMARAAQHYSDLGYSVEDVSLRESFDLLCTKEGATVFVEVKGTTSRGEVIALTRNEVRLHLENHPATALFVLHSIDLTGTVDAPFASGGEAREILPWQLREDRLTPLTFSYEI